MPAYKDTQRNTWYCQFYYTDWKGDRRQKRKRGFIKKKELKNLKECSWNNLVFLQTLLLKH